MLQMCKPGLFIPELKSRTTIDIFWNVERIKLNSALLTVDIATKKE
jgi:hypothetical protein